MKHKVTKIYGRTYTTNFNNDIHFIRLFLLIKDIMSCCYNMFMFYIVWLWGLKLMFSFILDKLKTCQEHILLF